MEIANKLSQEKDPKIFRKLLLQLESLVDLHSQLPVVCLVFFGNEVKSGLIFKKENSEILFNFLIPFGNFFLKLQNNLFKYGMNLDVLPPTTRKLLREQKYNHISYIYKIQKQEPKVMFNMLEYYIFSFAYAPVLAKFKIEQGSLYYDLVSSYLGFVLPTGAVVKKDLSSSSLVQSIEQGIYSFYKYV